MGGNGGGGWGRAAAGGVWAQRRRYDSRRRAWRPGAMRWQQDMVAGELPPLRPAPHTWKGMVSAPGRKACTLGAAAAAAALHAGGPGAGQRQPGKGQGGGEGASKAGSQTYPSASAGAASSQSPPAARSGGDQASCNKGHGSIDQLAGGAHLSAPGGTPGRGPPTCAAPSSPAAVIYAARWLGSNRGSRHK